MSAEGERFAENINTQLEQIMEGTLWYHVETRDEKTGTYDEMRAALGDDFEDEYEPASMWDFVGDCYDKHFIVEADCRTYRSVQLMLAGGGPTVWLDTETATIDFHWGGDTEHYPVYYGACDEIDEIASEIWNSQR